jgi:hypothetical protein
MSLENVNGAVARATVTRAIGYELCWRPEQTYAPGSRMELRVGQLRAFHLWSNVAFEMARGRIEYCWKRHPNVGDMFRNPSRTILRAALPYGARKGEPLTIGLTLIPACFAALDYALSVWTLAPAHQAAGNGEPEAVAEPGSTCVLRVTAGPVDRLGVYARPAPDADGRVRIILQPEDRFGNAAAFAAPVPAELRWLDETRTASLQDALSLELPAGVRGAARLEVRLPIAAVGPEDDVTNARPADDAFVLASNPVLGEVMPSADGQALRPAFGEIHWHTDYSGDGQSPFEAALRRARDEMNLDFAAPSDHNPTGAAWDETVRLLDAYEQPGHFATFYGWENASAHGHENYYFLDPDHPMICGGAAGVAAGGPKAAAASLARQQGVLAIPHHTNAVAAARRAEDDTPFWHPYPWDAPTAAHRLAEIMQGRGNQERDTADDAWRAYHQAHAASVQEGLELSYRVGFTGGTDSHTGRPGRIVTRADARPGIRQVGQILTGVWTARLDRQGVFDALWARRTWAVWDTRAIVWFQVNNRPMGADLAVGKGTDLTARIRIWAEAPLRTLEIVSEKRVVWSGCFAAREVEASADLPPATASTHYYLRGLLRGGGIFYASPVFVDVTSP